MAEDRPIKILLVDDEDGFRQTLAKRLTKRGLAAAEVPGGREALEYLAANRTDVVVMDVKMPGMDGLTALPLIKTQHPKVEVILLTGQASAQDGVAGIMNGAFDYLTKPVEVEHLAGKIRQAADRRRWMEEQAQDAAFREKVEQRMNAAERLASLGTMAAGIAHEINNPLAIISESAGYLRGRLSKDELSEEVRRRFDLALGKIQAGVDRARRITHQLLNFARRTDWSFETFDLGELAGEVVDLTRKAAANAQVAVSLTAPEKAVMIHSDPNQVRQVLINIVQNAIQAVDRTGSVKLSLTENGTEASIRIEDDGPGIPKENLDRIFEPFFSTKPPGKGTGLGLSVSRNIVDKLGGRIQVETRIGAGTVFTVILPPRVNPSSGMETMATSAFPEPSA